MNTPKALTEISILEKPTAYRGKVRNIYDLDDKLLIVATDRLSAFDFVLASGIPQRGIVLTQLSAFWFEKTAQIIPNHLISTEVLKLPEPFNKYTDLLSGRSMLVQKAQRLDLECIVRGYLAGSGWREYQETDQICGISLPASLKESEKLPEPIFTPSTKAASSHDENISEAMAAAIIGENMLQVVKEKSLQLYKFASEYALQKGIIIADTKFEFGVYKDQIILIDEIFTPDSSRFWLAEEYKPGYPQKSFDKEFVRQYLRESGWNMQPPPPELPEEIIQKTRERYLSVYEWLTGKTL